MITSEQARAARALLRLTQIEVARRAEVSLITLRRVEAAAERQGAPTRAVQSIQHALEAAGAEFIAGGVRRRRTMEERARLLRDLREIARRSARLQAQQPSGVTEADLYDDNGLPG